MLDPQELDRHTARQILGGLDRDGLVSPYCALALPQDAGTLNASGRFFPDLVLAGARVRAFVEEVELEPLDVLPGRPFERSWPLPEELRGRAIVSVRFSCGDFVYRGPDLRHCVVFQLERLALE